MELKDFTKEDFLAWCKENPRQAPSVSDLLILQWSRRNKAYLEALENSAKELHELTSNATYDVEWGLRIKYWGEREKLLMEEGIKIDALWKQAEEARGAR